MDTHRGTATYYDLLQRVSRCFQLLRLEEVLARFLADDAEPLRLHGQFVFTSVGLVVDCFCGSIFNLHMATVYLVDGGVPAASREFFISERNVRDPAGSAGVRVALGKDGI